MPQNLIHDKFARELFSQKDLAVEFLKAYLPKDLTECIDIDSIATANTSYLSTELKETYADIVWDFRTTQGKDLQISLLLEHKSYKDPKVVFQVLEYLANGYQQQLKNKTKLKPIIPLIYYHGKERWKLKKLDSYFKDYDLVVQKYLPSYENVFINLTEMPEEQIMKLRNGMLKGALLMQRNHTDPKQLMQNIINITNSLNPYLHENFIDTIFVYMVQILETDKETLIDKLIETSQKLNNKVMSIYDQLIQEGLVKGRIEGRIEGVEEGMEKGIEKTILNAFDNHIPLETIRLITGESAEKINEVLKRNQRS
jgi:predicted transposase/invertase (TIGR01784 family)